MSRWANSSLGSRRSSLPVLGLQAKPPVRGAWPLRLFSWIARVPLPRLSLTLTQR
jgi:hypothetical protein